MQNFNISSVLKKLEVIMDYETGISGNMPIPQGHYDDIAEAMSRSKGIAELVARLCSCIEILNTFNVAKSGAIKELIDKSLCFNQDIGKTIDKLPSLMNEPVFNKGGDTIN